MGSFLLKIFFPSCRFCNPKYGGMLERGKSNLYVCTYTIRNHTAYYRVFRKIYDAMQNVICHQKNAVNSR